MFTVSSLPSRALAALLALALSCSAQAMSYVPMADASLYDGADAIVTGTVQAVDDTPATVTDASNATRYQLTVQQVLKGDASLAGMSLNLRVPGSRDISREGALIVPGMPRFDDGERVLVFLNQRGDGNYAISQLVLGAFHVRDDGAGGTVAQRDLGESHAVAASKSLSVTDTTTTTPDETTQARSLDKFSAWIAARSVGESGDDSYWTTAPAQVQTKFVLASPAARWFEFGEGGSVKLYAGPTGQLNLSGGGYDDFQKAIAAWNNDAGSTINFVYGGSTSQGDGMDTADGIDQILFNDPLNDIAGAFDCSNGGVLAYGGYRAQGSGTFNGANFLRITEGDVVIQDGTACALSLKRNTNAQEVFAHELGHVLGLQHSCGDTGEAACVSGSDAENALMRPDIHGDGRGASLSTDDKNAVAYLYGASTSSGTGSTGSGGASAGSGSSSGGGAFGLVMSLGFMFAALIRRR